MAARQYTQREWRLLSWWASVNYPNAEWWLNLRLGPTLPITSLGDLTPAMARLSRVRNRYVDALFYDGIALNLIEAKINPDPGIFSQLLHYARMLRIDPLWQQFSTIPLNLIALVYDNDESVQEEAPFYGVRWIVYQPNLAELPPAQLVGAPASGTPLALPPGFGHWVAALTLANIGG
jgi:hypothetical protein